MEFQVLPSQSHELLVVGHDETFHACIAVHSTKLGPALGGIRMKYYETPEDMVIDAMKLSEGMSYKNAVAGLPFGGGKSTINAIAWTKEVAAKYAQLLNHVNEELGVDYMGAPDMNTDNNCMKDIQDAGGRYCFWDSNGGDCSGATALGVFRGLQALSTFLGKSGKDFTVNIEGLGKVGGALVRHCIAEGWDVCVSDINTEFAQGLAAYYSVAYSPPEDIKYLEGVYCPCAVGGTVDKDFVENSEAYAVCGAANNQLVKLDIGMLLASRNKLYVPDFVANSGGVIAVGVALEDGTDDGFSLDNAKTVERVDFIRQQASAILLAQTTQVETRNAQLLAMKVAEDMINA